MHEKASPFYVLRGGETPVRFVEFSRDGSELLAATEKGEVVVWDLSLMRIRDTYQVSHEPCLWVMYGQEAQLWVYCRTQGLFTLDRSSGKASLCSPSSHPGYCRPDATSTTIYFPSFDNDVACFDIEAGKLRHTIQPSKHCKPKLGILMCIRALGNRLLCGYESGHVVLWESVEELSSLSHSVLDPANQKTPSPAFTLDFDPILSRGVVGCADEVLRCFALDPNGELRWDEKASITLSTPGVSSIRMRTHGTKIIAAGSWDNSLRFFCFKSSGKLRLLARSSCHKNTIDNFAFCTCPITMMGCDELVFAAGSIDGSINLWNLYG